MRRRAAWATALALAGVAPQIAFAQSVTVVGVRAIGADELMAANLAAAIRRAVPEAPGWTHTGREVTLAQMSLAFGCDDAFDPACLRQIGRHTQSDRLVFGTLRRAGSQLEISVQVFNVPDGRVERQATQTFAASAASAETFARIAMGLVRTLAAVPPASRLMVAVNVAGARVLLDGRAVGVSADPPATVNVSPVTPGEHRLEVTKEGYRDVTRTVNVAAEGPTQVPITLEAEPPRVVARAEPRRETHARIEPDQEPETPGGTRGAGTPWIGYTVAGAGVVAAGVGLFFSLAVSGINNDLVWMDYRRANLPGEDICVAARAGTPTPPAGVADMCSRGETFEILQYVMYASGAVMGALGALLVLSAGGSSSLSLRVRPQVGRNVLGLGVTANF